MEKNIPNTRGNGFSQLFNSLAKLLNVSTEQAERTTQGKSGFAALVDSFATQKRYDERLLAQKKTT